MKEELIVIHETDAFMDVYGTVRLIKTPEGIELWIGGRLVYKWSASGSGEGDLAFDA